MKYEVMNTVTRVFLDKIDFKNQISGYIPVLASMYSAEKCLYWEITHININSVNKTQEHIIFSYQRKRVLDISLLVQDTTNLIEFVDQIQEKFLTIYPEFRKESKE